MNKLDKFLGKYFIFALPALVILFIIEAVYGVEFLSEGRGWLKFLNNSFGWILMTWIVVSLYLFLKMIFSKSFREITLKRFIRIRDSDEREAIISGEAAKLSMLSTFALMTLLIFLSTMVVKVGKFQGEALLKSDKKHFISIGFNPLIMNKKEEQSSEKTGQEFFTYRGLPIPTSLLLLIIFSWQLISFHLIVRKSLRSS